MNSLSLELVRKISLYLEDKLDIGRFRLVQRTFAQLGKEVLFGCLYVQPSQQSLSRLLEISRNPSCSQFVREVALSVDAMRVMVWRPFTEQLGSKDIDKLDYRTLIIFRNLVDECQEFQKSSDYVAMLSASFSRLPRLSTISLREISPSASLHSGAVTLIDQYAHAIDPPHFHGSWGEKDHFRAFSALISAAYFAGATLKSFTTTGLIDQALFGDQKLLRRAADVFKSCRELRLLFCGEESEPTIYGRPVPSRLFENSLYDVISPAVGLEELTVEFSVCPSEGRGGVLFRSIFGKEHLWSQLREVVLGAIDLPYGELLAFLDRHKATLRTLSFSCCDLFGGGSWCDVMKFLKEKLKLEKLELDDTLGDGPVRVYSLGEVEMMVDYVLHGGESLPEYLDWGFSMLEERGFKS